MVFPRLLALSEAVWSPAAGKDYEDFKRRLRYQLGRLDKQDVRLIVHSRSPIGLEDSTRRRQIARRRSHLDGRGSLDPLHADGSDPTDASPR